MCKTSCSSCQHESLVFSNLLRSPHKLYDVAIVGCRRPAGSSCGRIVGTVAANGSEQHLTENSLYSHTYRTRRRENTRQRKHALIEGSFFLTLGSNNDTQGLGSPVSFSRQRIQTLQRRRAQLGPKERIVPRREVTSSGSGVPSVSEVIRGVLSFQNSGVRVL